MFPKKTIWCYTGYVYDKDILPSDGKKHCAFTEQFLSCIDVLVDGFFIEELKDISLQFRGSRKNKFSYKLITARIHSLLLFTPNFSYMC